MQFKDLVMARLGGDEFGVIVLSTDMEQVGAMAVKILETIEVPMVIDGFQFIMTADIGITRYPMDTRDRDTLLNYADMALLKARENVWDTKYAFFEPSLLKNIERKILIDYLLRNLDPKSNLIKFFQPQIEIKTGKVVGFETLTRWNHPTFGYINPAEFFPIAEENGVIFPISEWSIDTSFRYAKKWNENRAEPLTTCVNISPKLFSAPSFFPLLISTTKKYNVNPNHVAVEITELSAPQISNIEKACEDLRNMGHQISLDDFGTGYSSLSYLVKFNPNILKIAKELIDNIATNEKDLMIVKSIIRVAKGLDLYIIAEGVEDQAQFDILKELECDAIQGYFTGRPVSAEDFERLYLKQDVETITPV